MNVLILYKSNRTDKCASLGIHGNTNSARNKDQKLVGRFLEDRIFTGYWLLSHWKCTGNMADQNGFWSAKCWNWSENGQWPTVISNIVLMVRREFIGSAIWLVGNCMRLIAINNNCTHNSQNWTQLCLTQLLGCYLYNYSLIALKCMRLSILIMRFEIR